jgi:hypothetical protein
MWADVPAIERTPPLSSARTCADCRAAPVSSPSPAAVAMRTISTSSVTSNGNRGRTLSLCSSPRLRRRRCASAWSPSALESSASSQTAWRRTAGEPISRSSAASAVQRRRHRSSPRWMVRRPRATSAAALCEVTGHGLEPRLGQIEGEARVRVAARLDRLPRLGHAVARLLGAPGDESVVHQGRQLTSPQRQRQITQRESAQPRLGTHVRRELEHPGDAQADLPLLFGHQNLTEDAVGELLALGGVEQERGLRRQRSAQGIVPSGEVERSDAEVGRSAGIRAGEGAGGLAQRPHGGRVVRVGARRQLDRHLHGKRPCREEDVDRLALQGAPRGPGQGVTHGLPDEVVPEHEQPVVLGEQLGDDQLVDRSKQHRWRNVEHHRQLVEREPASEDGGDERAASDIPARRSRMVSRTRAGRRVSRSPARSASIRTRPSSRHPWSSSTSRKGLPDPLADHGELPVSSSHRGSSHACLRPRWRCEVHCRGRASIAQRRHRTIVRWSLTALEPLATGGHP